jgi:serine/threonine-protein kinase
MFRVRGFFASNWNKKGHFANDLQDNGDGTVTDRATGLMWQQSGSEEDIDYAAAQDYAQQANAEALAGDRDWCLPTLEEAVSLLMHKKSNGRSYIAPVFDDTQWWIWTDDTKGPGAVWAVFFGNGDVDWLGTGDGSYVRLCRTAR